MGISETEMAMQINLSLLWLAYFTFIFTEDYIMRELGALVLQIVAEEPLLGNSTPV